MSAHDNASPKPALVAYSVVENKKNPEKPYFHQLGAAFTHLDGEGYTLKLNSMPLDGRITLRKWRENAQQAQDTQAPALKSAPNKEQGHEPSR